MSNSVQPHGQQPTRLLCPRDSLGKNTGVGCPCLLWSIQLLISKMIDEISDGKFTILFPGSVKGPPTSNFFLSASTNLLFLLSRVLKNVSIRSHLKSLPPRDQTHLLLLLLWQANSLPQSYLESPELVPALSEVWTQDVQIMRLTCCQLNSCSQLFNQPLNLGIVKIFCKCD